ncbi:MAG: MmgE/PrpD family protein, partial [Pseudomonadota bacterium]
GCNSEQIRHAAGIAEYHGPRSQMMRCIDFPTNLRDGVGWGAPSGVTAAYLANEGFTGAPALTCEGDAASPYWRGLGADWLTLTHTHYKLYPCCRWAHSSMDSARRLMEEHALVHTDVQGVEIRTFEYAVRLAGHEPATLDELSYAIAFPVAAIICRGQMGPAELTAETLNDPDILRISRATRLIDDAELTARSVKQRWSQVTLVLANGRRVEGEPCTPRGDLDAPLSNDELQAKFELLSGSRLSAQHRAALCSRGWEFDALDADEFANLMDLCLSPGPGPA